MAESQTNFPEYPSDKKIQETVKVAGPGFDLPISSSDLADIIDKRKEKSQDYFKTKLKLEERAKLNQDFWLGKHFDEGKLYEYQIPHKDNLIWRDEETRVAIIASRMPDIIVTPANETSDKIEHARTLQRGLSIQMGSEVTRRLIKDGLRQHDINFTAAIKCRWDKNINDFVFELVPPGKLIFDHTATIPQDGFTSDNMEFINEWVDGSVAQLVNDFPGKKDEIFYELGMARGTTKQLNSKARWEETWFSFYGNDGILYEGTSWKINKLILDKQRNCYYDWEGYEEASDEGKQTLYHNHFNRPRKPYIFFVYQNLGRGPVDDTTCIEQAIPLQKSVNKRGRQITEIADRTVPKIAAIAAAISKEDLRRVTNDPDEHLWLSGQVQDVRAAVASIQAIGPSPVLFQDLLANRSEIDAMFSTHSTTRGEVVAHESGISKQITREGDLAVQDDTSKIVIERVVFEMANWAVQMEKLYYDKNHFVKDVGKDGEGVFIELKRDIIDEGIAVNVRASTVDKAQRRSDAQTAAARRQIDPLTYWQDLDAPNPKERTRLLVAFLSGNFGAYAQMADLTPSDAKDNGAKEAEIDIERIKEGEDFEPPKPTPAYVTAFINFVNSSDYKEMSKRMKNRFKDYIAKLKKNFEDQYLAPQEQGAGAPAGPTLGSVPPMAPQMPPDVGGLQPTPGGAALPPLGQ